MTAKAKRTHRLFTPKEDELIVRVYTERGDVPVKRIAALLGRSYASVRSRICQLGYSCRTHKVTEGLRAFVVSYAWMPATTLAEMTGLKRTTVLKVIRDRRKELEGTSPPWDLEV